MPKPSLRVERALLRSGAIRIAGMDEVGRGSLAGPVSVGVAVITAQTRSAPQGLKDSKLLTAQQRRDLLPRVTRWADAVAVGHASPQEIDAIGLTAALRRAGWRALAQVTAVDHVLLDGNCDWLTPPQDVLFPDHDRAGTLDLTHHIPVTTRIKADQQCSAVAAASVVAKVTRDDLMVASAERFPQYEWQLNKGYASPQHLAGIRVAGLSGEHRHSWRIAAAQRADAGPAATRESTLKH
ncbi:MAG: ribonuclease HII [Actinomycetia bacterium]|nr:ribonuclease HII [Actinomycetes bacterium]